MQVQFGRWFLELDRFRRPALRACVWAAVAISCVSISLSFVFSVPRFAVLPPVWWLTWFRGAILAWGLASFGAFFLVLIWRRLPGFDPERRGLLKAAGAVVVGAPFAATAFGVLVQRVDFQVQEVNVPIPNLPKDLAGLTLVQLSDIHLSPFLDEKELARVVAMANETRAHLALVTGDLITGRGDPIEACLKELSRLRADAGVFGCLGNHEIYAHTEDYTTRRGAQLGMRFLRQESRALRFGSAVLNLAGVDYQRRERWYLVSAEQWVKPDGLNVLLSHNPNVFPVAVQKGYDLTISGHTHGGQVTVEILDQSINVARFYTPYVHGLYRDGPASIYVTRGIGTVGIPARLGAPPEITLLRLCAT
jgi:predicted MPP superfamily phosphohydrolase